jgi:hypothetical protein
VLLSFKEDEKNPMDKNRPYDKLKDFSNPVNVGA